MTKTMKIRGAATFAVLALALAACGDSADVDEPTAATSPAPVQTAEAEPADGDTGTAASEPDATVEVPEQLQFETTTVVDATPFEGASLAGQDVILWFWAPWCATCQAESGQVAEAIAELPEGVTLVGVSGRAERADMQGFVDNFGVDNFVHLADEDGSIWSAFGITTQPSYAMISDDGSVRVMYGAMGRTGILMQAEELLAR